MGYETDEYIMKYGCIKYVKSHDFFMDEKEITYKLCEDHTEAKKEAIKAYEQTEERKQQNKEWEKSEKGREARKAYYEKNKERILEQKKKYAEEHKEEKKAYREEHKEERKEYSKQYRQDHKEERNAKTICECGGSYSNKHKAKHFSTKLHQAFTTKTK